MDKQYETMTVYFYHWELGMFPEWECYGYSQYDSQGIPLFAEIRREKKGEENEKEIRKD